MKTITFKEDNRSYKVIDVQWETDEDGIPVDISIISNMLTDLQEIADKYCYYGSNYNEYADDFFEALYARLKPFEVLNQD